MADTLSSRYAPDAHPELAARITDINQNASFNRCLGIEGTGKRIAAARCFLKYARSFPESKYVAKAYWNAAINYEKERKIEKSIRALMLIVNNAADTEEEPKALFLIARNLTNIATYGAASKAYEYYAQKFPGEEKALVALQNAAFYRMGLGEYDKAIENYRKYMKLVGKKDKAKAAEVFYSIGKIYEQRIDSTKKTSEQQALYKKVIKHYKEYLRNYAKNGTPDLEIGAFTRIGNAYWNQAQPALKRRRKSAQLCFSTNRPTGIQCSQGFRKLAIKREAHDVLLRYPALPDGRVDLCGHKVSHSPQASADGTRGSSRLRGGDQEDDSDRPEILYGEVIKRKPN